MPRLQRARPQVNTLGGRRPHRGIFSTPTPTFSNDNTNIDLPRFELKRRSLALGERRTSNVPLSKDCLSVRTHSPTSRNSVDCSHDLQRLVFGVFATKTTTTTTCTLVYENGMLLGDRSSFRGQKGKDPN